MTVLKLNKKNNSILIITDEGETFITSIKFVTDLINSKNPKAFILCNRLLLNSAPDRFKPSPIFDPEGLLKSKVTTNETLTTNNDGLSQKSREQQENKGFFQDKAVW